MDDALKAVLIVYWSGVFTGAGIAVLWAVVFWRRRRETYSAAFWEIVKSSGAPRQGS